MMSSFRTEHSSALTYSALNKIPSYVLTLVLPVTSPVDINVSGSPSVGLIYGLKTDQVNLIIK